MCCGLCVWRLHTFDGSDGGIEIAGAPIVEAQFDWHFQGRHKALWVPFYNLEN